MVLTYTPSPSNSSALKTEHRERPLCRGLSRCLFVRKSERKCAELRSDFLALYGAR